MCGITPSSLKSRPELGPATDTEARPRVFPKTRLHFLSILGYAQGVAAAPQAALLPSEGGPGYFGCTLGRTSSIFGRHRVLPLHPGSDFPPINTGPGYSHCTLGLFGQCSCPVPLMGECLRRITFHLHMWAWTCRHYCSCLPYDVRALSAVYTHAVHGHAVHTRAAHINVKEFSLVRAGRVCACGSCSTLAARKCFFGTLP
jgi:hypothetical protein